MPGARRRGVWRRAIPYHDIAGLKLGLAERLAQLRSTRAQLRGCRRPLRPYPHRCPLAAERYQRMDRTARPDVQREPRSPNPLSPPPPPPPPPLPPDLKRLHPPPPPP